jgi:hypothetical protein
LDKDTYLALYGFISLSIIDVKNYIRRPEKYYKILKERYSLPE